MHMSAHDANLVGALGLVLADRLADAAEAGPGGSAATALVAIGGAAAGATIDAVARIVGLSHSGTVRVVDRLARDGLVERRRGADQRSAALVLTPVGRRAARRVLSRREANVHGAMALLTDGERADLVRIADRLLSRLADDPGAERHVCRLCDREACGRSRGRCPFTRAKK